MADDRMKNDEQQRNMGGGARDQDYGQQGQQSPGRTGQGQKSGQHAGGYGGSQRQGGQNKNDMEDDDLGAGNAQTGGQGRGGQNR